MLSQKQFETLLDELDTYLAHNRQVGHTHTLIHGLQTIDKPTFFVVLSVKGIDRIKKLINNPNVTYITLNQILNGSLRLHAKPLVLDNDVLHYILLSTVHVLKDIKDQHFHVKEEINRILSNLCFKENTK